ncbi:MAG: bifunctional metallophosphatase/5'-nucleotidase [Candidatus Binatia bacterium]
MAGYGTIYIDMDDVLCETARGCVAIIEREFGKRMSYERLTDFNLGEACGLDPEETAELYRIVHHPDELLKLEPIEGAVQTIRRWIAAGYEIAIVTGRPPVTSEPSLAWLAQEGVPYHSFTVVDKYGRFSADNKTAVTLLELARRRFCFAVEDSPIMAAYLAERMGVPVKLFDRPWNRKAVEHPRITRVHHWDDIAKALRKVSDL